MRRRGHARGAGCGPPRRRHELHGRLSRPRQAVRAGRHRCAGRDRLDRRDRYARHRRGRLHLGRSAPGSAAPRAARRIVGNAVGDQCDGRRRDEPERHLLGRARRHRVDRRDIVRRGAGGWPGNLDRQLLLPAVRPRFDGAILGRHRGVGNKGEGRAMVQRSPTAASPSTTIARPSPPFRPSPARSLPASRSASTPSSRLSG
jgi:hypothetical protein